MPTYAEVSKYIANRKKVYEKLSNSPLESERNTAKRMIERIDKRTDELFDTQEFQKETFKKSSVRPLKEDVLLGNGGITPKKSLAPKDKELADFTMRMLLNGNSEDEVTKAIDDYGFNKTKQGTGIWSKITSPEYLDYFKTNGVDNNAKFSIISYDKDGGRGYGVRQRPSKPKLESEWTNPYHPGVIDPNASLVGKVLNNITKRPVKKKQEEIDSEIAEIKNRNIEKQKAYEKEIANTPLFIDTYRPGIAKYGLGGNTGFKTGNKLGGSLNKPISKKLFIGENFTMPEWEGYSPKIDFGGLLKTSGTGMVGDPENGRSEILSKILSGGGDFLNGLGQVAMPLGSALGEFAMRNVAIKDMQAPEKPILNPSVKLNAALDTGADENVINRAIRARQLNADRNASNAQIAMSEYGASTGQKIQALNNVSQQRNNYRAQMENSQAQANQQNNLYNSMLSNEYMKELNGFNNNRVNAKAATWAQLMNKIGYMNQEQSARKHDLAKTEIMFAKLPKEVQEAMRDILNTFQQKAQ